MKKITTLFIYLISLCSTGQTLYTDEKGVKISYTIEQTKAYTFCTGKSTAKNFSNKRINIWKVTLEIENGYSTSIVPRGVGIANISVYPDPVQPYSQDYCPYSQVENYVSSENRLDQSLFSWGIRDRKVKEIKSGELITNITYLYLYEGQTPTLSNWQFLGYRLKNDFKSYDPILVAIKDTVQGTKTVIQEVKKMEKLKESGVISQEVVNLETNNSAIIQGDSSHISETTKPVTSGLVTVKKVKPSAIAKVKPDVSQISDTTKTATPESVTVKKTQPCPGEKSLEYKKMSNKSSNIEEQRAYSWLSLYYSYRCKCESGMLSSDVLIPIINNVVDSYMTNTNGAYGKIEKITKCGNTNLSLIKVK